MNSSAKHFTATCPSCYTRIRFRERPRLREIIVCHECEETLEVVRLNPLKLEWSLLDDEFSWNDDGVEEDYNDRYERYAPYHEE